MVKFANIWHMAMPVQMLLESAAGIRVFDKYTIPWRGNIYIYIYILLLLLQTLPHKLSACFRQLIIERWI